MENDKKSWSEIDIEFLKNNYSLKGSEICSIELKRNKKAIIAKARKLGIKGGKVRYKYSREMLEPIVKEAKSIRDVLSKMGLRAAGGNYQVINKYIKEYKLNIIHFEEHAIERIKKFSNQSSNRKTPLELCLIDNSTYDRADLKRRLYSEGLKKRECELCGQGEEWKGKKMSLILDHKNGVHNDNRIDNLRIVCPNCNATLDTHAGKNIKKK
jgi:hypothetical protein